MSSIGSATSAQQSFSPLKMLQAELASEVKAGAISAADQSALSSALSDIDSATQASKPSAGSRPSPDEMKAKIEGLIEDQVESGNLISEQAEELKGVFESAFKGGPGGPGGAGGPPPGGAAGAGDSSESTDEADTNGDGAVSAAEQAAYNAKSTTGTSSSSDSDTTKLLKDFLASLKESQSKAAGSTYGGSGSTLASKLEALIVNYQA